MGPSEARGSLLRMSSNVEQVQIALASRCLHYLHHCENIIGQYRGLWNRGMIEASLHIGVTPSKPNFFDVAHGRCCGRGVERGIVRMFWPEFDPPFIECERLAEVANMRHSIDRLWETSPSSNPN